MVSPEDGPSNLLTDAFTVDCRSEYGVISSGKVYFPGNWYWFGTRGLIAMAEHVLIFGGLTPFSWAQDCAI